MIPIQFDAKIWKQGGSMIITIPKDIHGFYNLKEGDILSLAGRVITQEELKEREEFGRIKASYPNEAQGSIIHGNEEIAILDRVFFTEIKFRAGSLGPGESFDNLPLHREIIGMIYKGRFLLSKIFQPEHYEHQDISDKTFGTWLTDTETLVLKTMDGKEIKLNHITFEDPVLVNKNPILRKVRFSGKIQG